MLKHPAMIRFLQWCFALNAFACVCPAQLQSLDTARGDAMIAEHFRIETEKLTEGCLAEIKSLDDWKARRQHYRRQLLDMLGLNPLPEKSNLDARVTGRIEHDEIVVENLHFQSRPGLYVTGNLYLPKNVSEPLPTILYVCGHARVEQDGISYGNKANYQHHGAWFARNGYACLTIDTLQLGEIKGIHHGTYSEKMWWWLNRGYTPAGVEAWNCIRALDYLETRPEVDVARFGVTGRSGGGAYSWWIAAIDDRIQCAVPVAGITDLQNHVARGMPGRFETGCVEGHCDCMFMFNTHRWDYPQVAALVAPRPLLISNTDSDHIFPLDGVYRTFESVRRIYRLLDASENVALQITAGGHADTQELRIHAFRWFNRFLKNDESLVTKTAEKFFEPQELKVFDELPKDQRNTSIQESFVPVASPTVPKHTAEWERARDGWMAELREKTFGGWPAETEPLNVTEAFSVDQRGVTLKAIDFTSQNAIRLRLYVAHRTGVETPELIVLNPVDDAGWQEFVSTFRGAFAEKFTNEIGSNADPQAFGQMQKMFAATTWAMAWIAPRGIGATAWDQSEKKQTQHRRRFYLLGQSLDGMRVYDVRRAIQVVRSDSVGMADVPLWLQSEGPMAGITLYASLFEPEISRLDLYKLPKSHRDGPFLPNVRRIFDTPQAVALATERSNIILYDTDQRDWAYPATVATLLHRKDALKFRDGSVK